MGEREEVLATLEPLIEQAEREGKVLHCNYQDLWFTPTELRALNAEGRFIWGAVNWTLYDPQKRVEWAVQKVSKAQQELEEVRKWAAPK